MTSTQNIVERSSYEDDGYTPTLATEADLDEVFGTPIQRSSVVPIRPSTERREPSRASRTAIDVVALSDIQREEVAWLWPGRVPFGKLTVLEGDPGLGKSTLTLALASSVSTGFALRGGEPVAPACVLVATYEDGLADTVRPRLEAAGADLTRVIAPERPLRIPEDVTGMKGIIEERSVRLVVIDPLSAALSGGTDSHNDADVRRALHPLSALAEETGAAIVIVRHFTKGARSIAIHAGAGSIAISAAARVVLQVHKDPEDETRRLLAVAKCNLASLAPSLRFRFESSQGHARIGWEGEVNLTAEALVSFRGANEGNSTAIDETEDWLRELLIAGPKPRGEVMSAARDAGYSTRTVQRAASRVGVQYERTGFGSSMRWFIATSAPKESIGATSEGEGAIGASGANGGVTS